MHPVKEPRAGEVFPALFAADAGGDGTISEMHCFGLCTRILCTGDDRCEDHIGVAIHPWAPANPEDLHDMYLVTKRHGLFACGCFECWPHLDRYARQIFFLFSRLHFYIPTPKSWRR